MHSSTSAKIGERFSQHFQVLPALSQADRDETFFIRHDVYARELGFEPVRPDQRERDAHDEHSLHCLMRTAEDRGRPVGCVRLVLADPAHLDAPLPFEKACGHSLDRSICDPRHLPRERIAEVSRLAVMSDYRRRKGEQSHALAISDADCGGAAVPRFPNIPLALYFATLAAAKLQGIDYLFTLTEPRLAKHFALMGVKIQAIGAPVEHRGMRVPSITHVAGVIPGLRSLVRPIWHEIYAQMEAGYVMHEVMRPGPREELPLSDFGALSA